MSDQGDQHNNVPHQDQTFDNPAALSLPCGPKICRGVGGVGVGGGGERGGGGEQVLREVSRGSKERRSLGRLR